MREKTKAADTAGDADDDHVGLLRGDGLSGVWDTRCDRK